MENLVTIPQGFFPRMCEIAHQKCLLGFFFPGFFQRPQSRPLNRFHAEYVKRRGSSQGSAFSGLENKNLTFNPLNPEKNRHFGPAFETALHWGKLHVNSP